MTTALVQSFAHDLTDEKELGARMRANTSDIEVYTGGNKLKLDLEGWSYGISQTPIEEGSQWAVNAATMKHGWIRFPNTAEKKAGQTRPKTSPMVPLTDPRVACPDPGNDDWKILIELDMVQVSEGEDFAKQVQYSVNTVGGHNAVKPITDMVGSRVEAGNQAIFPIVELDFEPYFNEMWKRDVASPILNIVEWVDKDELLAIFDEAGGEEAKAAAAAPKKRATKKAAEKPARSRAKAVEEVAEEEPETEATPDTSEPEAEAEPKPVRRRRR